MSVGGADGLLPAHRDGAAMNGAPALAMAEKGRQPTLHDEAVKDGPPGLVAAQAMPPIVIGQDLAETVGASVGDTVWVTSPQGELTPFGPMPKVERFQLVGIFKSGFISTTRAMRLRG